MMSRNPTLFRRLGLAGAALTLAACTVMPTGPSVMVLPGTGQTFDRFRFDDADCRQYAYVQVGGKTAATSARESAVTSAAASAISGTQSGSVTSASR